MRVVDEVCGADGCEKSIEEFSYECHVCGERFCGSHVYVCDKLVEEAKTERGQFGWEACEPCHQKVGFRYYAHLPMKEWPQFAQDLIAQKVGWKESPLSAGIVR